MQVPFATMENVMAIAKERGMGQNLRCVFLQNIIVNFQEAKETFDERK